MLDTVKHRCQCAVKIHSYILGVQYLLRHNVAKLVYIYRDLRDVYMSLQKYKGHTRYFDPGDVVGRVDTDLKGFYKMEAEPNVLFQKYEDMMENNELAVHGLSSFLGLEATQADIDAVVAECSVKQMASRSEFPEIVEGHPDPLTLVYAHHVSASMGKSTWRESLDPTVAKELTVRFKDWLQHTGYETEEK